NPNRIQSVQSRFLPTFATPVSEDPSIADNEDVRNKLLEAFILFHLASIPVNKPGRGRQNWKVFLDFQAQPLKHPQLIHQLPLKTKHSFFRCHSSILHSPSPMAMANMLSNGSVNYCLLGS